PGRLTREDAPCPFFDLFCPGCPQQRGVVDPPLVQAGQEFSGYVRTIVRRQREGFSEQLFGTLSHEAILDACSLVCMENLRTMMNYSIPWDVPEKCPSKTYTTSPPSSRSRASSSASRPRSTRSSRSARSP